QAGRIPVRRNVAGALIPGGIGCWREKTPARCRYAPDNTTGAILASNNTRIAAKRCHYKQAAI
ncbi:Small toxic polypeptide ldrD, partial [Escherichia coli O26:H11 str. CVM10026]